MFYCTKSIKTNLLIKERAKQKCYHSVINDTKHNTKVLWKTINDITHYKKRSNNSISNLVNEIVENIVDPNAMAYIFNIYFSENWSKNGFRY